MGRRGRVGATRTGWGGEDGMGRPDVAARAGRPDRIAAMLSPVALLHQSVPSARYIAR